MASLPTVTSDIPRDLRQFLERVREAIGGRGEDEVVTVRKLVAAGIAEYTGGSLTPTEGATSYGTPPAPTGLGTSGALANIILTWDAPIYRGHSYTEVWAAQEPEGGGVPDLGEAVLVGMSPGSIFSHSIGGGATRWYWVKFVNVEGQAGPFNGVEGTEGTTGQDPAYLLEVLAGEVTETQLSAALGARINLIDADSNQEGSVNSRLAQAQSDLYDSIAVVQGQVNDLLNLPAWDSATTYAENDQVTYNGGLYVALQASTNVVPTNTSYWQKLGDYTTLGDAVAAQGIQIAELDDGLGSLVTQTNTLATQLRGNYTGNDIALVSSGLLHQERQARSSADTALASDITTLTAFVNTKSRVFYQSTEPVGSAGAPLNVGDLWIDTDITYANDYLEGDYVIRSNRMYRYDGSQWVEAMDFGFADWFSAINIERTARVDEDEALAAEITTLTSAVNLNAANILSEANTRANQDSSLANSITSLTATVTSNYNTLNAAIQTEATARADGDTALSQSITTLQSTVNSNTSAIQTEATARANADTALSQSITTLQSTVNGNTTAIQTEATTRANADNSLFAQYTVKVEANGYVSGFGLASTANNATPTSEFIVRADTFAIASPSGPGIAPAEPFIVRTTATTIGGVTVPTGVYIKDAFIQNGSISNAKIGNAAIDTAKISDLAVTTAKIGDAQITTAKIGLAQITNALMANASIATANIQNAAIDTAQIKDGAITNAKIGNAEINIAKIDTASIDDLSSLSADIGTITAGKMQSSDGKFVIDLDNKLITITV